MAAGDRAFRNDTRHVVILGSVILNPGDTARAGDVKGYDTSMLVVVETDAAPETDAKKKAQKAVE